MSFLLDTNLVSELRRRNADPAVHAWVSSTSLTERDLSVLTIGEIRAGIERRRRRDPVAAGGWTGGWAGSSPTMRVASSP